MLEQWWCTWYSNIIPFIFKQITMIIYRWKIYLLWKLDWSRHNILLMVPILYTGRCKCRAARNFRSDIILSLIKKCHNPEETQSQKKFNVELWIIMCEKVSVKPIIQYTVPNCAFWNHFALLNISVGAFGCWIATIRCPSHCHYIHYSCSFTKKHIFSLILNIWFLLVYL